MATSSIFANFDITDSKKAESFVKALDFSAQENTKRTADNPKSFLVSPNDIKTIWAKRKQH